MKERKPYERRSNGRLIGWYILWNRKQTWLGRFKEEAHENWKRLKAGKDIVHPNRTPAPVSGVPTVREIADKFLAFVRANRKPATYKLSKHYLDWFCDRFGNLRVTVLKKHHLQEWIDANTSRANEPWNNNTANSAARAVIRCFNWAVKLDHLDKSPLKGFEKPKATPRECYLTADEWKRLAAWADEHDREFKDTLMFMRLTGARPQEMRNAEKRHFDPAIPAIVFPKHEAKGEKAERVIHLAGEALLIVQKRCLKHPEGPIFRRLPSPGRSTSLIVNAKQRAIVMNRRRVLTVAAAVILAGWLTFQSSVSAKAKRIKLGQSLADVEAIMAGERRFASSSSGGTTIHFGYEPRVITWIRSLLGRPLTPPIEVGLSNDRVVFVRRGTKVEGKRPKGIHAVGL